MVLNTDKPIFLLIDGHALLHRAYHAFPPTLKTSDGVQVNAVYGFTSILLEVLIKFHPEYVVCAFDMKGPTFRNSMYSEYKAQRKKPDQEMIDQEPLVFDVLKAFNIPVFKKQGFEADDIIGTLVNLPEAQDVQRIIVTGDQDLFQLIKGDIYVYISGSKFSQAKLYDAIGVKEKFGFGPEYITDYKGIRGDTSDNIPGVKGIGEKGGSELIVRYGHIESIYENIGSIEKARTRLLLEKEKELAVLSKKLATIKTDVDLDFALQSAELRDFDAGILKELFKRFGFRSLLAKIPESNEQKKESTNLHVESMGQNSMFEENVAKVAKSSPIRKVGYEIIDDMEKFEHFFSKLSQQKIFAFDCETTGVDFMTANVLGISFSWEKDKAYYLNLNNSALVHSIVTPKLKEVFENSEIKKVGHNLKYDCHVLRNTTAKDELLDITVRGVYFDTMIAAFVIGGGSRNIGLKNLAYQELGMEMTELSDLWNEVSGGKEKKNYTKEEIREMMLTIDSDKLGIYSCADADATWQLYENSKLLIIDDQLVEKAQFKIDESLNESIGSQVGLFDQAQVQIEKKLSLFWDIEMPLIEILIEMEREGVDINVEYLKQLGVEIDEVLVQVEKNIYEIVGHQFNIASPKQVGEVLFDELSLPGGKKTKTHAWQSNEGILQKLSTAHPLVPEILKHRELSKLRSTYIISLIDQVNSKTKKIHTSYNQTIATTGRLSSTNPNLQNIPVATEWGLKVRKAFVAGEGRKFLAFDYSQQELRILAHMSGEPELLRAYNEDIDVHALTASRIFNLDIAKVSKKERSKGKTLNFSLIYGITSFGLAERMQIPREEAEDLINSYFRIYPEVKKFFNQLVRNAESEGRIETMFGRYRDTSGLRSSNFRIKAATEREIINFPIQGTGADMMKIAMEKCFSFIKLDQIAKEINAKILLQVHDELIIEVDDVDSEKINKFGHKIVEIMSNAVILKVPVKVGMIMGDDWGELK